MTRVRRQAATAAVLAAVVIGGGVASAAPVAPAASKLPAGFPKPPHSKVVSKLHYGPETAYTMKVKSEPQAFSYWKKHLPSHGWTISKAKSKDGVGAIQFKGHGYGPKGTALSIDKTPAE